jgi:hypothetical protein
MPATPKEIVKPFQTLRLAGLHKPINAYALELTQGKNIPLRVGKMIKRWIALGLQQDVAKLSDAARKRIGVIPLEEASDE